MPVKTFDWSQTNSLINLTHLDGRNAHKLIVLRPYFSEFAWMKLRLRIIISYTRSLAAFLTGKKGSKHDRQMMDGLADAFCLSDAQEVVRREAVVNHDVKAIELYLVERLTKRGLARYVPYVNLGIGSEDINSIALCHELRESREAVLIPAIRRVTHVLSELSQEEEHTVMVARTHGQPASVTTFGKELAGPLSRLCDELDLFQSVRLEAKCSGEVGSFQAFMGIDRTVDWLTFTDSFVRSFGLHPTHAATQIAPYDSVVRFLQILGRINSIFLDLTKNMWLYVLLGYLNVKKIDTEVGSAGMPHKVNPIYFEGAEGGLEMANGIIETLVRKLPLNRLQRDFSDSTIRRNLVMPIALSVLSYQSLEEALKRIVVDRVAMKQDLDRHAEVWMETVKTYVVMHGITDMYDRLKKETRGRTLCRADLQALIWALPLTTSEKKGLMTCCEVGYNAYPQRIVREAVKKAV